MTPRFTASSLVAELTSLGSSAQAAVSQRFFKTGKGQYGEGDVFVGVMVPQSRLLAKKYRLLALSEVEKLLQSKIHEARFIALQILVLQFAAGDNATKKTIYQFYLGHTKYINNWDLVDTSADKIVGEYLLHHSTVVLRKLARSKNIWERRIAILATFQFIKNNRFEETLAIATMLLTDTHDLLHKAVGWMLREVGKRSLATEEVFLQKHAHHMPRTMLRYAIERFPELKRKMYLKK